MNSYSFFHRESGVIHEKIFSTDDQTQVAGNTPIDHVAFAGHHDHLSKRVDVATGQVIEHVPHQPSPDHEWNSETKRWQLNAAASGRASRKAAALARIAQLESAQHRAVRECILRLSGSTERLAAIDDEIFSLRSQIT
jgi:hypothetical protein